MNEKETNKYKLKIVLLTNKNKELQQRIDKVIELLENDYFEDGSGNNINKVLEILGDKE